ncbi:putative baseplate assembly protein [Halopenitus sp. H-Gu1]|uniref:putative baseplate assembly protein n=1 Tax=Halopenitus sp. H-Gu1 TaxID=3242697 RepID=UPI00359CEE5F
MVADPELDGRRRDAIREHIETIAPHYVEDWDADAEDPGSALVAHFAEMAEDVIERLDSTPAKHRVAFFDELGFDRRPPRAATVPVQFTIAPEAGDTVRIDAGTEVVAEETDDRPARTFRFEAEEAFEATPARLQSAYSVDPASDGLFDHAAVLDDTGTAALFAGEDRQENLLYIGHAGLLTVSNGSTIRAVVETTAAPEVITERLQWEYYGEKSTGDGESEEGWHVISGPGVTGTPVDVIPDDLVPIVDGERFVPLAQRSRTATKRLFRSVTKTGTSKTRDEGASLRQLFNPNVQSESILSPEFDVPIERLPSFPEISLPDPESATNRMNVVTVELEPDGPLLETEVNGRESRWIRCRVPDERTPTGPLDVELADVSLAAAPTELDPDMLLANDVPQDPEEGSITPFGDRPSHRDALYVGCEEAFTKADADVTITFQPELLTVTMQPDDPTWVIPEVDTEETGHEKSLPTLTPVYEDDATRLEADFTVERSTDGGTTNVNVSWEYWNGDGWATLSVSDETEGFTIDDEPVSVTFSVPADVAATSVAGHDGVWVRARLVGGDYGDRVYVDEGENGEKWVPEFRTDPPEYGDVSITYEYPEDRNPEHLFSYNARTFGPDRVDHEGRFEPFRELADEDQTLYLGFDRPLDGGPLQLFVDLEEHEYPDGFASRVRWEYCVDPDADEWTPLDTTDETGGFTERGLIGLVVPEKTTAFERFGEHHHWIRARVRGESFGQSGLDLSGDVRIPRRRAMDGDRKACGEVVVTNPPAGEPTNARPRLHGIHPNTGHARNVTVVDEEILGSSDGAPDQSFSVTRPPVIDGEVWVNEQTALSANQRERLAAERPDDVLSDTAENGSIRAFWVRWHEIDDFLDSTEDHRHYVLDRTAGEITFGDGVSGRIPPRGRDNVRVSYRTGGGVEGNVGIGAVTGAKSSLPYVEEVTNPAPGTGGAASESMDDVLGRAPQTIRDRGRAVTPADFERIAADASRRLANVRCIEGMNRAGEREPGWVTLLIVPDDQRMKPVPSIGLKRDVEDALSDRAPASLVARDRIVVRGPSYVAVGIEATVVGADVRSVSALEERIDDHLREFCHPLTGGPDGDGWAFGDLPDISTLFALIEGIEGVDHVSSLSVTFDGGENVVTVTEGEATPSVAADTLVYNDSHELTVRMADRPTGSEGS